jgi:hypothetical protein
MCNGATGTFESFQSDHPSPPMTKSFLTPIARLFRTRPLIVALVLSLLPLPSALAELIGARVQLGHFSIPGMPNDYVPPYQSSPHSRSYPGGSTSATAGVGVLSVEGQYTSPANVSGTASLKLNSYFADTVTIDAPGRTGQQGAFTVSYVFDGSYDANGYFGNSIGLTCAFVVGEGMGDGQIDLNSTTGNGFSYRGDGTYGFGFGSTLFPGEEQTSTHAFTFGQPFDFFLKLGAQLTTYKDVPGDTQVAVSLVKWSGIKNITGGGTPAANATVSSVSAINWTQAIPAVVSHTPVATEQSVVTDEDTAKAVTLAGSVAENGPLTFTVVTQPAKGTLSGTAPNLTYTPNANANGSDSFTFKASNGTADSPAATVTLTINAVNDAPAASGQSVVTAAGAAKTITLAGSDLENSPLTFSVIAQPGKGILGGTAPNLTYTPNANVSGTDSFTFKASDGTADSATATVNITINAVTGLPAVFDPVADFSSSNPSGAWTYGFSQKATAPFELMTDFVNTSERFDYWRARTEGPYILKNKTQVTQDDGGRSHPPDFLNLDPSFDGRNAVLRFSVPSNSIYRVFGRFVGLDASTTDTTILVNGAVRSQGVISGKGVVHAFDLAMELTKGETIDFSVGQGTSGSLYDGTGLRLHIESAASLVPECLAPPAGIALWIPAEGNSTDVIRSNEVKLLQGAAYDNGMVGDAFSLVGQANYIAITDSPSVRPATNLTLEGWFKFTEPNAGSIQTLVGKTVGSGFFNSYAIYYRNGELGGFVGSVDSIGPGLVVAFRPIADRWYHLAYTFNDELDLQSLYVDGFPMKSSATTQRISYDNHPLTLGAEHENEQVNYFFTGMIDEFSLYARDLAASEILEIYKAGSAGKCGQAPASSVVVRNISGKANIFGAGHLELPTSVAGEGGIAPAAYRFTAGAAKVLKFFKVEGGVSLNGAGGLPFYGPDGGPLPGPTDITSVGGISGLKHPNSTFLAGVFLTDSEPRDPAPSTIDFNHPSALTFRTLKPAIGQVFYIGDGKTPGGIPLGFLAPANATRLFLGIVDGWNNSCICGPAHAYHDNSGGFQATFALVNDGLSCAPVALGLISWWPYGAEDAVIGNSGRLEGGVQYVLGLGVDELDSTALRFDGQDDAVVINNSTSLNPPNLTVQAWVRLSALDSASASQPGLQYIIFKQNTRDINFEGYALMKLRDAGVDRFAFALSSASGAAAGASSGPIVAGRWYHLAGTFDGQTTRLFVDGLQVAANAAPANFALNFGSKPLYFGRSGFDGFDGRFFGDLDEPALFNRALSAEEIATIYLAGSSSLCVPLGELPAFGGFSYSTASPVRSSNPWQFTAVQSSTASDLRVRVQSTTTPNAEESWKFLSGTATRLDSNWTLNTTDVPSGVRYFRAIASAPRYLDRVTEPLAIIGPITVLEGIAPFGDFSYQTTSPLRTGTEWTFSIEQRSLISDFRLRVQSSPTWNVESSWRDLPGGGKMGRLDSKWTHSTSDLPLGTNFFRVIASAPTYADRISAVLGPLTIGAPLPRVEISRSSGSYSLQSISELENPREVYVRAVAEASAHFFFNPALANELLIKAAITLEAAQNAEARLTIEKNQSLTLPGLNIGQNTSLILGGTINGSLSLIGNDGATLIGNDGSTLIGNDGSTLIGMDHATLQAIRGSGALNPTLAPLIGNDGASVISRDGAGILTRDGAGIITQGGGTFRPSGFASGGATMSALAIAAPSFTGVMTVNGDYRQESGTGMSIAIAGTNTLSTGSQEYDQLTVSGRADLGGVIGFGLFNRSDKTLTTGLYQPALGATFDVVVATNIVTHDLMVRGPIWGDGLHFNWSVVDRPDGKQALRLVAANIAPFLVVQPTDNGLEVAYPMNFTGYILQRSSTLTAPNWTILSNSTNRVKIDTTGSTGFFRMLKQ